MGFFGGFSSIFKIGSKIVGGPLGKLALNAAFPGAGALISAGTSISGIAGKVLKNTGGFRDIAELNGIKDIFEPLKIGTHLKLPSIETIEDLALETLQKKGGVFGSLIKGQFAGIQKSLNDPCNRKAVETGIKAVDWLF